MPWRSGPRTRALGHSPAGCVFTFVPGGCFLSCDRGHPSSEAHLPVAPRGRPGPRSRSVALSGPLRAWLLRGRGAASAPGVLAWAHLEGRRPFARGPAPRGDCGPLLHVRRLGFYRKFLWAHTLPSFLPPGTRGQRGDSEIVFQDLGCPGWSVALKEMSRKVNSKDVFCFSAR